MRTLHYIFPITGPNNGVKVISNHIRESIFNNEPISIRAIDTAQAKNFSNFGKFGFTKVVHFFEVFIKLLAISKNDLVYINVTPRGYAFYRDLLFLTVCSLKAKNITAHIHANGLERKVKKYNRRLFCKLKIIIINRDQKNRLDKLGLRTYLVPNSLPDFFNDHYKPKNLGEGLNLIFLSNISIPKGINRIEKISEIISNSKLNCTLNVYGGALTKSDKNKIEFLNQKHDFLNYHGPIIEVGDKYDALSQNDLLLFLSDENYEVYPLVYIEALMAGLPILTTNQIVSKDLAALGVSDTLNVDLGNFESCIKYYLYNPNEYQNRKRMARNVYSRRYSFSSFIENIEKIILSEKYE